MKTIQTASIIGGEGNFGRFIREQLEPCLEQVNSIDVDTSQDKIEENISASDLVVFATPIRNTAKIISEHAHLIVGDKLAIDISGLKQHNIQALAQLQVSEKISLHPMFKHGIEDFQDRKIIKTSIKAGEKWEELEDILTQKGCKITELTAQQHDKKMAVIQALTHITNMFFIQTLKNLGIHPDELSQFSTPIYEAQSKIGGRFLNQNASLFADMQIQNPEFRDTVLPELINSIKTISSIVQTGDFEGFEETFEELGRFLGDDFLQKNK